MLSMKSLQLKMTALSSRQIYRYNPLGSCRCQKLVDLVLHVSHTADLNKAYFKGYI